MNRSGKGSRGAWTSSACDPAVALSGRQIKRLTNLVDMLLDVSQIQAGRLELNRAPVDLRELVAEIVDHLGDQLAQSGSALAVRAEQPVIGRWDPYRLEQVVTNLLTNAIKFGETRADRDLPSPRKMGSHGSR